MLKQIPMIFLVAKVIILFVCASLHSCNSEGRTNLPEIVSVPALITFGDSFVDQGNNNYIAALGKANHPPYGKDFVGGNATGRFSNGKTLADFFVMKVILFFLYASLYLHHNEGKVTLPQNVSVPAVIAFGDSLMDQGNNNDIKTVLKANFPPYGMDFISGNPTGRFSNGKTLADFFAKGFGVKEYLPAYLDPLIQDKDLLTGVSFASGGAGYDPLTAKLSNVMPLSVQLEMFKQYIITLKENIGEEATMNIIAKSVFLVSAGSNDFLVNYFTFPIRRVEYDVPAYCNKLVKLAMRFIKEIHKLGARRIAVFSTSAIGCIPVERTLHGGARRMCIDKYNKAAKLFNNMLKLQLDVLARSLPHSRIAFSDFYNPLMNIIENPQQYDLEVTNRGCCGTGELEMCFLCNKRTSRTCHNDSNFFFWDSLHPTEKGCDIFVNIVLPDLMKSLV